MSRPRTAGWGAGALAALLIIAPAAASSARAAVTDLYYERALMSAADARCGLFDPGASAALGAAMFQARGAALRSGVDEAGVDAVAARAQARAAATACNAPDLRVAAQRVRVAFKDYARLLRMNFPGEGAGWKADRSLPAKTSAWRLSQSSSLDGAPITFGLAGRWGAPQQLLAVADLGEEQTPYAARLIMRDAARAPRAYLPAGGASLAGRTPPRWSARIFVAEARGDADAGLRPTGADQALAFRFPAAAAEAMAGLDPREVVTVEFVYAGRAGDIARRAVIEVGDFAAGRAFLTAAAR
jgi:hypothetical protein